MLDNHRNAKFIASLALCFVTVLLRPSFSQTDSNLPAINPQPRPQSLETRPEQRDEPEVEHYVGPDLLGCINTFATARSGRKFTLLLDLDPDGLIVTYNVQELVEQPNEPSFLVYYAIVGRCVDMYPKIVGLPLDKYHLWQRLEIDFAGID